MTDFRPWLRPTMIGPFATIWAYLTWVMVTAGALVLPSGERIDAWVTLLFLGSFVAAMIVVGLLAADVSLLRLQLRKLPTNGRAWGSSLLAPIAVWTLWLFFGFGDGESVVESIVRFSLPFVAGPLAMRFLFGERP
jgi:hypothetical protein